MKTEVEFINSKGQKLYGYFYKSFKSKSLIISCHGSHSYNSFPKLEPIFEFYQKLGFSLLRFDFAGYNKSEGEKSVVQRTDDIISAVRAFKKDYKEIIVSVVSLCAMPAIMSVIKEKSITKLVITNGLFNFAEINPFIKLNLALHTFFNKRYLKEKLFLEKNFHPEKIKIPTIIIYAENDRIVNPKQSKDLFKRLTCDKTLKVIHNSGHYPIKKENVMEGNNILKEWFSKYNLP